MKPGSVTFASGLSGTTALSLANAPVHKAGAALTVAASGALSRMALSAASTIWERLCNACHITMEVPLTQELESFVAGHVRPHHIIITVQSQPDGKLAGVKLREGEWMRLRDVPFTGMAQVQSTSFDKGRRVLVFAVLSAASRDAVLEWLRPFTEDRPQLMCNLNGATMAVLSGDLPLHFKAAMDTVPVALDELAPNLAVPIVLPCGMRLTLTVLDLGPSGTTYSGMKCTLRLKVDAGQDVTRAQLRDALNRLAFDGKLVSSSLIPQGWTDLWSPMKAGPTRSLATLALSPALVQDLVSDIGLFLESREFYARRGCKYKRTYLLYGPPGTGKTSLISALIGHFKLRMRSMHEAGNMLDKALTTLDDDDVIVLEEIDMFIGSSPFAASSTQRIVMRLLDGEATRRQLVFLTTNHPDKVPTAVMRQGRVDRAIYFGAVDADQAAAMYSIHFPEQSAEAAAAFGAAVIEKFGVDVVMPCAVQEHLIRKRGDPHGAATDLGDLEDMVARTAAANMRDALPKPDPPAVTVVQVQSTASGPPGSGSASAELTLPSGLFLTMN